MQALPPMEAAAGTLKRDDEAAQGGGAPNIFHTLAIGGDRFTGTSAAQAAIASREPARPCRIPAGTP